MMRMTTNQGVIRALPEEPVTRDVREAIPTQIAIPEEEEEIRGSRSPGDYKEDI